MSQNQPGNQAAWLDGQGKQLRVAAADMPKAGPDDLVVRVFAAAVNPVDWKIQDTGMFIPQWPTIVGEDIAGEVVEAGSSVTRFKKGDRWNVGGPPPPPPPPPQIRPAMRPSIHPSIISDPATQPRHAICVGNGNPQEGGFQLYSKVSSHKAALLPPSLTYAQGSVLPLALDTALVGLCSPATSSQGLGLPLPSLTPQPTGKTLVVWGGSSSVGALAIQLATAAGARVVAVASAHNFDFCRRCGAAAVLDYKNAAGSVVDDVVAAVQRLGGDFVGVYDAISLPDQSYKHTLPILEKLGGGVLSVVLGPPENPPSAVKVASVFGVNPLTHPVWEGYVTAALEAGKLLAVPEPLVVGKGLEAVQRELDRNKEGVSARKVVIEFS